MGADDEVAMADIRAPIGLASASSAATQPGRGEGSPLTTANASAILMAPTQETSRGVGCYVGLDVGTVRLGIARLDDGVATPVRVHDRLGTKRDIETLRALWPEPPSAVIVGLPPESPDPRTCSARKAREFARRVAETTGWPVFMVDEADSSAIARERLRAMGARAGGVRAHLDAWAAVVILQRFADGGLAEPVDPTTKAAPLAPLATERSER